MRKPFAFAAALVVCATPALAQADRSEDECGSQPETTGSLHTEPPGLHPPAGHAGGVEVTAPEDSWQEAFREDAERRRRDLLACGAD